MVPKKVSAVSKLKRKARVYLGEITDLSHHFRVSSHPVIYEKKIGNEMLIRKISTTVKLKIFNEGSDKGYNKYGTNWWVNEKCPYAFQYFDLDSLYPAIYFEAHPGSGHPDEKKAHDLYDYMQDIYEKLFKRRFNSILELGSGGGEITAQFLENKIDFMVVEGTAHGVEKLLEKGVSKKLILKENLKFLKPIGRQFDLVMCTEVAEHIEPFFASKVVDNCTSHARAVWFSAAARHTQSHYHHMNVQDIVVWDNLFANMGFSTAVHLDQRYSRASRLYISDQIDVRSHLGSF